MVKYRLGELFSGPGGMSYGAINAKVVVNGETHEIVHEWASDYDEDSCKTYSRNICKTEPGEISDSVHHIDVKELDIGSLPAIDILAFGFPCNDFSQVGESKGMEGEFGMLYKYGVAALNKHNPVAFVAENVSGINSNNEGKAFAQILKELRNAGEHGYNITTELHAFEHLGVPQARHRYIIVGIRKDLKKIYRMHAHTHLTPDDFVSAMEAFETPPNHLAKFGISGPLTKGKDNHNPKRADGVVYDRLVAIPEGENAWCDAVENNPKLRINTKTKLSSIYRRLDRNRPAYTVTGSGGGGTHMYHWEIPRALSNREKARLQTFPDDYKFSGGVTSVRKQIGMAVPPYGAKLIFEVLLATLAGGLTLNFMSSIEPGKATTWTHLVKTTPKRPSDESLIESMSDGKIMLMIPSISCGQIDDVVEKIQHWTSQRNVVRVILTKPWKHGLEAEVREKIMHLQTSEKNVEFRSSYPLDNDAILAGFDEENGLEFLFGHGINETPNLELEHLCHIQNNETLAAHILQIFSAESFTALPGIEKIQTLQEIQSKIDVDIALFEKLPHHSHNDLHPDWELVESLDLRALAKGGEMSSFNLDFGKGRGGTPRRWTEAQLVINQSYPKIPKEEFTAHTHDGISIQMHRSGQKYKNLSSKYDKKDGGLRMFGYWIKNLLMQAGVWTPHQRITEATFEEYGKTTLDFYKIEDNVFYMDFEPKPKA